MTNTTPRPLRTLDELRMLAAESGQLDVVAHGLAEHAEARAAEIQSAAADFEALAERFTRIADDLAAGTHERVAQAALALAGARRIIEESREMLTEAEAELKAMFDAAYWSLHVHKEAGVVERAAQPAPRPIPATESAPVVAGQRLVPGVR